MDQQIQQAVDIALSGTADAGLKTQAYQFINEVKSTEQGYKTCVELLLASPTSKPSDGLKFFILQVIDENMEKLGDQQLFELNKSLFGYLNEQIAAGAADEIYLRNKLGDIFGRLFCYVYPSLNCDFLGHFYGLIAGQSTLALDFYLRVLISIHLEVGDKLISRPKETQERNNGLKDLIRERDMATMVASLKTILRDSKDLVVLVNALKVVGQYIDWMEILLFMQDGLLNTIYDFLNVNALRNQACLTLIEIISKKMQPANKLLFISLLDLTSLISSTLNDDDLDFTENLARLANQIGLEMTIVLESDSSLAQEINTQLFKLWPIVLKLLAHEYDDVSQQVFPFIQQYLIVSKKVPSISSAELLSTLLENIFLKMKYDADSDGFDTSDDDDQFAEMRAKLKFFQDTIAALNPVLYTEMMPRIISRSIFENELGPWVQVELGLYELSNFADSLKNNLINVPKTEISTSRPYQMVQDFLVKIINNFHLINHPKNQLAFFELIIRHFSTKNFTNTTNTTLQELILKIIELFSDFGLFNGIESVRLRCWYLFFRFVNATKPKLRTYFLENLLMKIQPLLVIKAELPTRDEDDDWVENGNFNNQLYLFEALGMLVTLTESEETCAKCVDIMFQPLFGSLEACITRADKDVNSLIPLQTHHSLMAIATIIKGLDTQTPGKSQTVKMNLEVVVKIGNAAQVVLISLENFNKFESVRDAARFAFARLVPVLGVQSSVHLSKLVSLILAAPNLKMQELGDFAGFIGQMVHLFKNNAAIFQLLNDLLTPMVQKIQQVLQLEDENYPDLVREKYGLKRSLLAFISILVLNNQFSLLLTETNKAIFPSILKAIVEYSFDMSDPTTAKAAVVQLTNVISMLGCRNGKLVDEKDKFAETVGAVVGIDDFLMDSAMKICFEGPFQNPDFDIQDAQIRNVAQELSSVLKVYQQNLSEQEFVNFVGRYLSTMGLGQDMANDFCTKLVEMDGKAFKKYYVSFLSELKK